MTRGRNQFARARRDRVPQAKVLIGCEGKATEPGYFDAIRRFRRISTMRIILVPHGGTDPLTVVQSVIDARNLNRRDAIWDNNSDTAWAVFDEDDRQTLFPDRWNEALQLAQARDIHLAISHPCFELWYLLHHQEQNAALSRQRALQLLKRYHPGYEKSDCLFPEPLQPLTPTALQRAEELAARAECDGLGAFPNPSTGVCALVRHLLELPTAG